jgi:hypothetical protein
MSALPDPEMRRGGPAQATPAFQFPTFSTSENVISIREYQALKLQELFSFCRNTALAVASLAFAGGRR